MEKDILKFFSANPFNEESIKVACNTNVTKEILIKLSKDEDFHVRWAVAQNKNVTLEAMLILVEDDELLVRKGIAENENATAQILSELADDESACVRFAARRRLQDTK